MENLSFQLGHMDMNCPNDPCACMVIMYTKDSVGKSYKLIIRMRRHLQSCNYTHISEPEGMNQRALDFNRKHAAVLNGCKIRILYKNDT